MRTFAFALLAAMLLVPGIAQDVKGKALHEVVIEAPGSLAPESRASMRVNVYKSTGVYEFEAVPNAEVWILLQPPDKKPHELFFGRTDKHGSVNANFAVPALDEGEYELVVRTRSDAGEDERKTKIKVQRDVKILLTTDKPLYQPNQIIHIRALALVGITLRPVPGSELLFEIEDPKGNKVFKQRAVTSEYGIAALDFQLADEINMGPYRIRASVGKSQAEKTVEVKKYVLPKFKVEVKTDKKFYAPMEVIRGSVQADYFFGKPVDHAAVIVKAQTYDVEFKDFARVETKTNEKGAAEFEIRLPDYFVGQPLEKGNAFANLEVQVIDRAEHIEKVDRRVTVCSKSVLLAAIPESGKLIPGVENIVYVVATSPDGEPQSCEVLVQIGDFKTSVQTNDAGFGTCRYECRKEHVKADYDWSTNREIYYFDALLSARGVSQSVRLFAEPAGDNLLLRPDKAVYRTGERMNLHVVSTSQRDAVFIDLVKKGQTQMTMTAEIEGGKGEVALDIPPDLFGTIEVHAYKIMKDGRITRDTRVLYVQPSNDLKINVETGQQYRPGEEATIRFTVVDAAGKPTPAALGVVIVDEAVYALQEMQPGLEKIYFMLEQEVMKPRYQIKGGPSLTGCIEDRRQEVAKMLLANVEVPDRKWKVNTVEARFREFRGKAEQLYRQVWDYVWTNLRNPEKVTTISERRRRLKPNLIEEMVERKAVPEPSAKDPWGNLLTLEKLQRMFGVNIFASATKQGSFHVLQKVWQEIEAYVLENDCVAYDERTRSWRFKDDLVQLLVAKGKLDGAEMKDCWGDPITTLRLAELDYAFSAGNIARLTDDERKFWLYQQLVAYLARTKALEYDGKEYRFKGDPIAEILKESKKPERIVTSIVTGRRFDLAELARDHQAFLPGNLAAAAEIANKQAIFRALVQLVEKEGVAAASGADVVQILVDRKLLPEEAGRDILGRPFKFDDLMKAYPGSFELKSIAQNVLADRWNRIRDQMYQYCTQKRGYWDAKRYVLTPPEGILDELVQQKKISEADLRDPWGQKIRFVVDTSKQFVAWGHWMRHCDLISAGPDGKFDTQDDVKFSANSYYGYHAAYEPYHYVYYQKDHQNVDRYFWGYEGVEDEEDAGGPVRGKYAKELQRGAGMAPNAQDKLRRKGEREKGGGDTFVEPARIREWFPETLYWNPAVITDDHGRAEIKVPLADSITSWRLTAMANSKNCLMGSTTANIIVFQDFFVDIDFPVALTQNDTVSVPVAVFNYMKESQKVKLKVELEPWFELMDDQEKILEIGSNDIRACYFKIKVKQIGNHKFTVMAYGTKLSDAIRRSIEVVPDGKKFEAVINDRLPARCSHRIEIPAKSIDGSHKILFKVYPSVFAQVVDGMEGMLRMPYG